jgi:phosphate transport system substrate-binding protein
MAGWTCNGKAKDNNKYPNQHTSGLHEPYQNFGSECVVCGLTKEQVLGGGDEAAKKIISAIVALAAVLAAAGLGHWFLRPCPIEQQKSGFTCVPAPSPTQSASVPGVQPYRTLADVPDVPNMIVRYGGSTSFAPLRSPAFVQQILQSHPGFNLSYTGALPGEKPGSGSGIRMLIEGQLSVAESSRTLKDEEFEQAKTRGFQLEQIPIAIDGIALYVNRDLQMSGLTATQVKDIFTGRITNWKQVGGPNLEIRPFSRDPQDGGTPEFFQEKVLSEEGFALSIQKNYIQDTTLSLRTVAGTSGGIGYATASEVCNQQTVKVLAIARDENSPFVSPCNGDKVAQGDLANDTYPITRRLFVIIKRDGTLDQKAGIAYANLLLSDEGQQLIQEAGLVPIRTR